MTKPTGLEPTTAVRITVTSVTERAAFRQCRRRWFLAIVHRLEQTDANENFWIGELVHAGLAAYYLAEVPEGKRRERHEPTRQAARDAYEAAAAEALAELQEDLGFLWPRAAEPWEAAVSLGRGMLEGYFRYDQATGGLGEVLAVEERWEVPIPGTTGVLRLRIDLVIRDRRGRVIVWDHKALASKPSDQALDQEDQWTGYAWGYWRATGVMPDRVGRNVLLKREALPPRVLKNGSLSKDRGAPTTYELYLAAIKEHDLDRADYEEHLAYLAEQGWDNFFVRQESIRPRAQLLEFERNLATEWEDMVAVAGDPARAYPSPGQFTCSGCLRPVCLAMMTGEDPARIIRDQYQIGRERS